jgi:hypothetical protein
MSGETVNDVKSIVQHGVPACAKNGLTELGRWFFQLVMLPNPFIGNGLVGVHRRLRGLVWHFLQSCFLDSRRLCYIACGKQQRLIPASLELNDVTFAP